MHRSGTFAGSNPAHPTKFYFMAKLCTETISFEAERGSPEGAIRFKFDIYVTQSGEFTTTLPKEVVDKIEDAQIHLSTNRNGTKGFLSSETKDGLIKKVSDLAKEYVSRELISEKLVIQYSIETQMSYQLSPDGKVCPNGIIGGGTGWRGGVLESNATYPSPFGLRVYVGIFTKSEWRYKSGVVKSNYEGHWGSSGIKQTREEAPNLHWIANLTAISSSSRGFGSSKMAISEMDYTEQNAGFFVDLVSALCLLNEKILPIIKEKETLINFINSSKKLLN